MTAIRTKGRGARRLAGGRVLALRVLALGGLLAGCSEDGPSAAGDGGVASACKESDLIAQCPAGANPVLGVQADDACSTAVGGLVSNAEGHVTAQCQGVAGCRALCRFAVACTCGVSSVTRDGVVCADCQNAASCGNNRCEGGETPQNCPIDCGNVCTAGTARCDGDVLETCNLQGRYDRLFCPNGEVCQTENGVSACARRPEVIIGDAGVQGDGGTLPMDGRIIPGDGTLPAIVGVPGPEFPREVQTQLVQVAVDNGNFQPTLTDFGRTVGGLGGAMNLRWRPASAHTDGPSPGGERPAWVAEGLGTTGALRVGMEGVALPYPAQPETTWATHCASLNACGLAVPPICDATEEMPPPTPPSPVETWLRDCRQAPCTEDAGACCAALSDASRCPVGFVRSYPEGLRFDATSLRLAGQRLIGASPELDRMLAVDLDTGATHAQLPIGDYLMRYPNFGPPALAISAHGQVAAGIFRREQDFVVVIWDLITGERRGILPITGSEWQNVALSPDGQVLALVGRESNDPSLSPVVSLWNVAEERRIVSIRQPPDENPTAPGGTVFAFSPDGTELLFDYGPGQFVEVWTVAREPERTHRLDLQPQRITGAGYAPDGHTLVIETSFVEQGAPVNTTQVSLWDTHTGQRWLTLPDDIRASSPAPVFYFSADGQRLVSGHTTFNGNGATFLRFVGP